MSLLALEEVDKTYADRQLLQAVSIVIGDADRIGLVGPNGCGKSTLLRMLAGVEDPDAGRRTVRRDLRVGYLPQEPELDPDSSIRDIVRGGVAGRDDVVAELDRVHHALADSALDDESMRRLLARQGELDDRLHALGGHDIEHRIESMLLDVGLPDPEARCGRLSGGERRRTAIARLLIAAPDLLLLDEPTNHLDAEVIDWLEDRLLQTTGALVLVTHDRYFLDRVVTQIVEVDRATLFTYEGSYRDYVAQRAARLEREARTESTRLNLLRRETEWIKRGPPARTTKANARIQRYEALREAAPDARDAELSFKIPCGQRLGEKVLVARGVRKSFGDHTVIGGLDLEISRGDRVGIVGPNGAGKSTLLQLCMGILAPDAGTVDLGPTVKFSYIDQKREGLDPDKTVIEEVGRGNDHVVVEGRAMRVESFLEGMLFPGSRGRTRIGDLSGGERNRVLLAKLLASAGNVLVLDEPTNDLDLSTLQVLEEAIMAFPGAALVVSHDRWFLDRIATRVVHLDGSGHTRVWNGDLSLLLERLAKERVAARAAAAVAARPVEKAAPDLARGRSRKLNNWQRRELDELPDQISIAEQELAELDAKLADPTSYTADLAAVRRMTDARAAVQQRVDGLYRRWEELESLAAEA